MATTVTKATGRKGRPNYPADYKLRVAKAACEPDISVAKLAQAHGLNTNMVFKWRRQLRAGLLDREAPIVKPELLAVTMVAEASAPATPATTSTAATPAIEIEINGAHVRVIGMVDPMQLRLVLRCLMPA